MLVSLRVYEFMLYQRAYTPISCLLSIFLPIRLTESREITQIDNLSHEEFLTLEVFLSKIIVVMHMSLPKAKKKKLIKEKEFVKIAQKVKKSLEQEAKYLLEGRVKSGNSVSHAIYFLP